MDFNSWQTDWPMFFVTLAGVIAAVFAIVFARNGVIRAILSDKELSQTQRQLDIDLKTFDLIFNIERSDTIVKCMDVLRQYDVTPSKTIAFLATPRNRLEKNDAENADAVYSALNFFEYLATGVKNRILSESLLRSAVFTTTIFLWDELEVFVGEVRSRTNSQTPYNNLENLVSRWKTVGYDGPLPD